MLPLKYLDLTEEDVSSRGAIHTSKEIAGQPILWEEVLETILEQKQSLQKFLSPILNLKDVRIILTGAGSSAFIGEAVQGIFQAETQRVTQAIATTDLVTHPALFFLKDIPTLVISFARSGNSPESIETINLANIHCDRVFHLIITCNKNGRVIKNSNFKNYYTFILPDKANDKGLAMTGSFTSMLLSAMLIAKLSKIETVKNAFRNMISIAKMIMSTYLQVIKEVAKSKYDRVIFLGSGPLLGIARECQLKLQELTDGQVICKHDSFLGFRHGPRVVINERSLIVYFFSNDDHVFQYEKDLVQSLEKGAVHLRSISFGRKIPDLLNSELDIEFTNWSFPLDDFYVIPAALIGQLLGFYKAIELGLLPDNPSVSGAINRVVQGVTIYTTANILD